MLISFDADRNRKIDLEICRAMFEKDPEMLLKLVSDWLENNNLEPSKDFQCPDYLRTMLMRISEPAAKI